MGRQSMIVILHLSSSVHSRGELYKASWDVASFNRERHIPSRTVHDKVVPAAVILVAVVVSLLFYTAMVLSIWCRAPLLKGNVLLLENISELPSKFQLRLFLLTINNDL
jgi:hypothetical protein